MKNLALVAALGLSLCITAWALAKSAKPAPGAPAPGTATTPGIYTSTTYCFSMEPPQFDALPQNKGQQVALFSGPPSDSFAPSVNVLVTQGHVSFDAIVKASVTGYEQAGFKIISQKPTKIGEHSAQLIEFTGNVNGKEVHDMALLAVSQDRFVVVTCTAAASQFEAVKDRYLACLESFKFTDAKP
jgi:hypothetical protein